MDKSKKEITETLVQYVEGRAKWAEVVDLLTPAEIDAGMARIREELNTEFAPIKKIVNKALGSFDYRERKLNIASRDVEEEYIIKKRKIEEARAALKRKRDRCG